MASSQVLEEPKIRLVYGSDNIIQFNPIQFNADIQADKSLVQADEFLVSRGGLKSTHTGNTSSPPGV